MVYRVNRALLDAISDAVMEDLDGEISGYLSEFGSGGLAEEKESIRQGIRKKVETVLFQYGITEDTTKEN